MKYSIKKQMIAIFIGLLVCMVAVLLFINMTFLEPYYIHNKESSFQEMYEELGQVVEDQSYSDEKATSALLREAERNNMSFLIVDRATGNKYTNVHNEDLLLNQLLGYVINQAQKSGKMLESTDQYQMLQAQDPWNETEYLVMWGNFDDGSQFGEYAGKRGDIQPFSDLHRMYPDLRGRRAGLVFFKKTYGADPGTCCAVRSDGKSEF